MAATATSKENIALIRKFNDEVFNGRQYDTLGEIQADDYVQHGPMTDMEVHGPEESLEVMKLFHTAFPDLEATEELSFSDGEFVCTSYTYSGTHDGEFMGIPPTGRSAAVGGVIINRIEDGMVAEAWVQVDFLGMLQQLDLVPSLDDIAA